MKPKSNAPFPWLALWVVAGLLVRLVHYLREASVWHDEAALLVNVVELDFGRLLGPLIHSEAAPPLFLWLERAVLLVFGDGLLSLRLLPFLASCLALVLFADAVRRVLPAPSALWAVAMFAFSDRQLWHACEAKPYAVDILVGTAILRVWLATKHRSIPRQCLIWLPWVPIALWVSYPACFMLGGLLAVLAVQSSRERSRSAFAALAVLTIAVTVCFLWLAMGPAKAQRDGAMLSCWVAHFPDWSRPWKFPFWTLFSTMEVARYNLMPFGQAMIVFAAIGARSLVRRGQGQLAVLLLLPIGLAWLASCAGAYPYGGSRVEAFASSAVILTIAASLPVIGACRRRWLVRGTVVLMLLPIGQGLVRTIVPWTRADCNGAVEYVRTHVRADDRVSWNHWEYEYYFRNDRERFVPLEAVGNANESRVWVIVTGDSAQSRDALLHHCADRGFRARREFVRTTVVLLN